MTYEGATIVQAVEVELDRRPFQALKAIACQLGIDRHTITRAFKHSRGRTFEEVQRDAILRALDRLSDEARPMSRKRSAETLGCSVWTLGRWILRWEAARSRHLRNGEPAPN